MRLVNLRKSSSLLKMSCYKKAGGRGQQGERKKGWGAGGAEEAEGAGGADNFWIQSARNPTQNFVHPGQQAEDRRQKVVLMKNFHHHA